MPNRSSSVQQAKQALGDRLREIRIEAGLTARSLAQRCGWHPSKVSKIEHGRTTPTAQDIRTWCEHCHARDRVTELVASLRAVEGMFIEWRRLERTGLRHSQELVEPLWQQTRQFRIYSSFVVPGPLQTAPYITAVLSARSGGVGVSGLLTALTLTGAATALLAKIRLLQLQRSFRRHAPRPGDWAMR